MSALSSGAAVGGDRATGWRGSRTLKETFHLRLEKKQSVSVTSKLCIYGGGGVLISGANVALTKILTRT